MALDSATGLGAGGAGIQDRLPRIITELQGLKQSLVDGAGAGTLVPVTGMDPEDTIVAAINLTDMEEIDLATLTNKERNASATITCLDTAADGDTVVVAGKTYTFKDIDAHTSYNAPPGIIPMTMAGSPEAADPEEMADRLAKAIMSNDARLTASVGPDESSPVLQAKVTVKVRAAGTAGNAFTLSETGSAVTVSGANFTGGLAESGNGGFSSSASLSGKKILLTWFDKRPGQSANPL
jgi:hypothetical protein